MGPTTTWTQKNSRLHKSTPQKQFGRRCTQKNRVEYMSQVRDESGNNPPAEKGGKDKKEKRRSRWDFCPSLCAEKCGE